MFVNYVAERSRSTPFNVAIGRVLLGSYLLWKLLSYEWGLIDDWPIWYVSEFSFLAPPVVQSLLPLERILLVGSLVAVVVGYRVAVSTFISAVLLTHMAIVMRGLNPSGHSTAFFIGVYMLIFYGLFRETDPLSIDGIRRGPPGDETRTVGVLERVSDRTYTTSVLRYCLVAVAVVYFGSGIDKVFNTPVTTWLTSEYLSRHILNLRVMYRTSKPVADLLLANDALVLAAAFGTLVLEIGFLVVVLVGATITPFVVGFLGMHSVIALAMGPFFFGQYVLFALFVPWDTLLRWSTLDRDLRVEYDGACTGCVRRLYAFELLDVAGTLSFVDSRRATDGTGTSAADTARPERSENGRVPQLRTVSVVTDDGETFTGFAAYRELLRQYRLLAPVVWVLGWPPVEQMGDQAFARRDG